MIRCPEHFGHVADPIERNFHVGRIRRGRCRAAVFAGALGCPERAARAAGERVALAKGIQDLAPHTTGRVRAERCAPVAAITLGGLDETEHSVRNEVLAVGTATPRIERARGDGAREAEVRDDALFRSRQITHETHTRAVGLGPWINCGLSL